MAHRDATSVTTAFFQERVIPEVFPIRRILPGTLMMFTWETWTLNTSSTARLISILFATGSTSKVYFPTSFNIVFFSVTIGRTRI